MGRRTLLLSVGLAACASVGDDAAERVEAESVGANVHVLTSRNDVARTGANTTERVLTTSNVKVETFGKLYARFVDGQIYAQPLYVSGVNGKNVVYVATEHNSIYAFDADDTRPEAPPLWTTNVGPSVSSDDTGCFLLTPEVGITSTPVIDLEAKTIWFTARTKENGEFFHKLHALDIATGQPRPNSPVVITATAKGNGTSSVGGAITFDPKVQMQQPGLLKVGNRIYLGFGSLCDNGPYHGWVLGYDAATLAQTSAHITTPNGGEGGIWNGGVGLAADDTGDIYYTAADVYDTSGRPEFNGADNLGNSIVRLKDTGTGFSVVTSFTPFDTRDFSPQNLGLGNGGGILIPGTKLFVAGDMRGQNFLVDRNAMGGQAAQDRQVVQKWKGTARGAFGGAFYKKGAGGTYYLWGVGDRLRAYAFDGQKFDPNAVLNPTTLTGYPGASLAISADGETAGTAIVWAVRGKKMTPTPDETLGGGVLMAFDATDVTRRLYSSDDVPADMLGNATKFAPPTVANGRVFVGTSSNLLVVYGLRSAPLEPVEPPPVGDAGASPTWTQIYEELLGPGTPGHCSGTGGCHTTKRGIFKCGRTQAECYDGLLEAGLVYPDDPAASPLILPNRSPLAWFGGGMPFDNPQPNPAAAAMLKAWVLAGAQNN